MVFTKYNARKRNSDEEVNNKVSPIAAATEEEQSEITAIDNHIYFYAECNKSTILQLNKSIKNVAADLQHSANVYEIPVPYIKLHINSQGGSLLDSLSTVDYIISSKAPVHSIVEGYAASAATLISVASKRRSITEHSFMLIHQLSSGLYGKYEELLDDMQNNTNLMNTLTNIYTQRTKLPSKMLKELLKKDLFLDSKQCLKYGLVDDIIT